jgi:hypothetical protein
MFTPHRKKLMEDGMAFPFKDISMAALSMRTTKTTGKQIHPRLSQTLTAHHKGDL